MVSRNGKCFMKKMVIKSNYRQVTVSGGSIPQIGSVVQIVFKDEVISGRVGHILHEYNANARQEENYFVDSEVIYVFLVD